MAFNTEGAAMPDDSTYHTPGVLALRLGVQAHHVVKLLKRGDIPHQRAGRLHLIAEADVGRAREALIAAGYLRPPVPAPVV